MRTQLGKIEGERQAERTRAEAQPTISKKELEQLKQEVERLKKALEASETKGTQSGEQAKKSELERQALSTKFEQLSQRLAKTKVTDGTNAVPEQDLVEGVAAVGQLATRIGRNGR